MNFSPFILSQNPVQNSANAATASKTEKRIRFRRPQRIKTCRAKKNAYSAFYRQKNFCTRQPRKQEQLSPFSFRRGLLRRIYKEAAKKHRNPALFGRAKFESPQSLSKPSLFATKSRFYKRLEKKIFSNSLRHPAPGPPAWENIIKIPANSLIRPARTRKKFANAYGKIFISRFFLFLQTSPRLSLFLQESAQGICLLFLLFLLT